MFVCCVLSGRSLCDELIVRPEESYRLWHVVCDQKKPRERGGHSSRWVAVLEKIVIIKIIIINTKNTKIKIRNATYLNRPRPAGGHILHLISYFFYIGRSFRT
jgi:hypothetical protein